MSEIPEDIRETAQQMAQSVADRYVEPFDADLMVTFAQALMAERERCAKIAENCHECEPDGNCAECTAIAAAIRTP